MQVIMNGKLIPVFVLAALMSCNQPPVKEQGPRPVKLAEVTSLNVVEKSFSGVVSPDQFSDLALGCADYIMVVEEGNDDGKFSDAATDAGIPITMLYTIADAVTPLQEIFGA